MSEAVSILGHFFSNCSSTNCQFLKLGSFCPEFKTNFAHRMIILAIAALTAIKLRLAVEYVRTGEISNFRHVQE